MKHPDVQCLLTALQAGTCHFVKLTRAEFKALKESIDALPPPGKRRRGVNKASKVPKKLIRDEESDDELDDQPAQKRVKALNKSTTKHSFKSAEVVLSDADDSDDGKLQPRFSGADYRDNKAYRRPLHDGSGSSDPESLDSGSE